MAPVKSTPQTENGLGLQFESSEVVVDQAACRVSLSNLHMSRISSIVSSHM